MKIGEFESFFDPRKMQRQDVNHASPPNIIVVKPPTDLFSPQVFLDISGTQVSSDELARRKAERRAAAEKAEEHYVAFDRRTYGATPIQPRLRRR